MSYDLLLLPVAAELNLYETMLCFVFPSHFWRTDPGLALGWKRNASGSIRVPGSIARPKPLVPAATCFESYLRLAAVLV